jgi:hypothetical protein
VRDFVSGALGACYLMAALFFIRFWRQSHDRLFAGFATAFLLLALQRFGLALAVRYELQTTWAYVLRLAAFVIILWAILDKNRQAR